MLRVIAVGWALALLIAGAFGIAGDSDGELSPLNVVILSSAAVLTLTWGVILAYQRRFSWLAVSVPCGGLVLVVSTAVAIRGPDEDAVSEAPVFFWIVYTVYVAALLLAGAVIGALGSFLTRRRRS